MLSFKGRPNLAVLVVHVSIDDVEVAVECCVECIEIIVRRVEPVITAPVFFVSVGGKPTIKTCQ